jgi:hypothetical protein
MGRIINVTTANVDLCDQALKALELHLNTLAKMTDDYPVECSFGNYSFFFQSRSDIESLIGNLRSRISDFRKAA